MDMLEEIKNIVCKKSDEPIDILMYYPLSDEVDLRPLVEDFIEDGHHVYFPVTGREDMDFYEVDSLDDFIPGRLGVYEPKNRTKVYKYDRRLTVCLTPGTEFSGKRQRKGRGKGYYDRFFANKENIYKIGIATESKLIPKLKSNPWDVDMDIVVTEERII